jgi:small neutral amino acid transporter SnatA (MarC family)
MRTLVRIAAVLLVMAGCWAVWLAGGMLLEWSGLEELDVPARIALVFGFLSACEAALVRLS